MHSIAPYLYTCLACATLLWIITFVLDYREIRRAALAESPAVDFDGLLVIERVERDRIIAAERAERDRLIDCVNHKVDTWIQRINETLNSLTPKSTPEPTLKQKAIQLYDRLGAFEQEYEKKHGMQQDRDESGEDFVVRQLKEGIHQSIQMAADFRIQFEKEMRSLDDHIQVNSEGSQSLTIDIDQAARTCTVKKIKEMRERLWECARTMTNQTAHVSQLG